MFAQLEALILSYASVMPLPLFASLSSFIEELIAPIPSGPVMLVMGSLASMQGYTLTGLALLTIMASLGKLAGSLLVYTIADKAEDVLSGRLGKLFGITHTQIQSFGARLGNGWKDYVLLTILRALPFIPSVVISVGSGILKIPLKLFIVATFVGTVIRDAFFIYVGYIGFQGAEELMSHIDSVESVVQILIVLGVAGALGGYAYFHRKRAQARGKKN